MSFLPEVRQDALRGRLATNARQKAQGFAHGGAKQKKGSKILEKGVVIEYHFDWDPVKEQLNVRKHTVRFSQAATIFLDPNQVSTYDLDHSENEERWATIGMDSTGVIWVVIHTYQIIDDAKAHIRLISARSAIRPEIKHYQEG